MAKPKPRKVKTARLVKNLPTRHSSPFKRRTRRAGFADWVMRFLTFFYHPKKHWRPRKRGR